MGYPYLRRLFQVVLPHNPSRGLSGSLNSGTGWVSLRHIPVKLIDTESKASVFLLSYRNLLETYRNIEKVSIINTKTFNFRCLIDEVYIYRSIHFLY